MQITSISNSIMNSITYILYSEDVDYCVLIDCGYSENLLPTIEKLGKTVKSVFLTHVHYDHIYGLNALLEKYPDTLVYTNKEGQDALVDPKKNFSKYHPELVPFVFKYMANVRLLEGDGETELFVYDRLKYIYTPGHDESCFSYITEGKIFTGDAYIPGIKTVVTFPRSNRGKAVESLVRLRALENDGLSVYPGHDISSIKISQAITLD